MFDNLKDVEIFSIPKMESPLSSQEMLLDTVVQGLYKVIREDMKHQVPLFLKLKDGFIYALAQKIVKERKKNNNFGCYR